MVEKLDEAMWKRALDCAATQFEHYARQGQLATPEQRRIALSDAMQHGIGLYKMDALNASAAAPRGWRDIATAPRDGTEILAYVPWAQIPRPLFWAKYANAWRCPASEAGPLGHWEPTHWMPLPEPPATGSAESGSTPTGGGATPSNPTDRSDAS